MTRERDTVDMFDRGNDRGRFGDNESTAARGDDSTRSNTAEIDIVIHPGYSQRAFLVSIDGNEARSVWLPKSQITIEHQSAKVNGRLRSGQIVEMNTAKVTLPLWLAKEKGLI